MVERRIIPEPSYEITGIINRTVDEPKRFPSALDGLSPRQLEAVRLVYGIKDGRFRSYREAGDEMHISRSTVAAHINRALDKIRYPSRVDRLPSLVDLV